MQGHGCSCQTDNALRISMGRSAWGGQHGQVGEACKHSVRRHGQPGQGHSLTPIKAIWPAAFSSKLLSHLSRPLKQRNQARSWDKQASSHPSSRHLVDCKFEKRRTLGNDIFRIRMYASFACKRQRDDGAKISVSPRPSHLYRRSHVFAEPIDSHAMHPS